MDALLRRRLMMLGGGGPTPPPTPYPAGYTPVEALYLPGAAWIALGYIGSEATDAYEIDLQITDLSAQQRIMCYNRQNSGCQIYVNGSLALGFRHNNSWKSLSGVTFDTNRHTVGVDYVNKVSRFDNTTGTFTGNSTQTSYAELGIGPTYTNNPALKAWIYGAKMWRSGVLVRDIIMLRDDNYAPYAFDLVTGNFLVLGGSNVSNITVGPDKNE